MRFQNIIQAVYCEPWFITHEGHFSIRKIVESKFFEEQKEGNALINTRSELEIDDNNIAHISIIGPIGHKLGMIEKSCGSTDVDDVSRDIDQALSRRVSGVMFHVDSPGGTVTGVPELADKIAGIEVPTVAHTDSLMASAAYYATAGVNRIFATQSANVGSIGTYIPWIDKSMRWEAMGVKADPIISEGSDLKAVGFGPSLSEEHRGYLQERVNQLNAEFKGHVKANRAVSDNSMRGQVFFGKHAHSSNLIDEVGSVDDAYDYLLGQIS